VPPEVRPGRDVGVDLQLAGKRAVITGGNRGIGLAVARALAAEGADIALAARDRDALGTASIFLAGEYGCRVIGVSVDTSDDASVAEMVKTVSSRLGGVDILINAAATPDAGVTSLANLTNEQFLDAMNVKVLGYLRCIREVAPLMRANGWGRIINISGLAARSAGSLNGSMRNVAVAAMTKNIADELGAQGINVTVVHPGVTVTEKTGEIISARAQRAGVDAAEMERRIAAGISIGRLVTADEVAAVVAFLASPRSVAINGDAIAVGGGTVGSIFY
jgi:NAD(P)-dependent dehydrogenase (short-subunit alcohol dehydrogenase family)